MEIKFRTTQITRPQVIDMNPDGTFNAPKAPSLLDRMILGGAVIAGLAGAAGIAMLALWLAMIAIPVALAAAGLAYAGYRWRVWQARR